MHVDLRFEGIGETGKVVLDALLEEGREKIGGEAVLRIDERFVSLFTFKSLLTHATLVFFFLTDIPSVLHLPRHHRLSLYSHKQPSL